MRRLEHKVVQDLFKGQQLLDVSSMLRVNVNQMHGIEIEEFPSRIAQTALWLTDHQMNLEASRLLGQHYVRLPLTASANIVHANALTTDWRAVISPDKLSYILGNPPFVGSKFMTTAMRNDLLEQFPGVRGAGVLDFVCAWYAKALRMMQRNPAIQTALVSTNSITQGEQVGILWKYLTNDDAVINFAHRTFKWTNEAAGIAAVYCVIIGFALKNAREKRIFDYPDIREDPIEIPAKNINPYLVDAPTVIIESRSRPISHAPEIGIGNKPIDDGNYLFTPEEKAAFIAKEPRSVDLFRRWIGSREFINGIERWCLWLGDTSPAVLRSMPEVMKRIENVRLFRLDSKSAPTRALASRPTRFHVENIPNREYIVIPEVSSERREYIPIGYVSPDVLASNLVKVIRDASLYHFAVLTSSMHMAWVRTVCGRLKSDYRYSKDIVYNNFPWTEATEEQRQAIERLAQGILDARARYPESTLADLYDPLTMPPDLLKAHEAVDRAVDRLYRKTPFSSDAERVALLFARYQMMVGGG